jgi:hypothetical protein
LRRRSWHERSPPAARCQCDVVEPHQQGAGEGQRHELDSEDDLPTATVLPGLIDTHVHLVADSEVGALDRVPGLGDDELDAVITEGVRRQLAAGVTTVRDLGDLRYAVVNRRDVQRAGRTREPEPTIVASSGLNQCWRALPFPGRRGREQGSDLSSHAGARPARG